MYLAWIRLTGPVYTGPEFAMDTGPGAWIQTGLGTRALDTGHDSHTRPKAWIRGLGPGAGHRQGLDTGPRAQDTRPGAWIQLTGPGAWGLGHGYGAWDPAAAPGTRGLDTGTGPGYG